MTLNFGNLMVFSAGNTVLFSNDLVVDDPGSVFPSPRVLVNQHKKFWM